MARTGLLSLAFSLLCLLLLFLGSTTDMIRFGPCGPDQAGLILLLALLASMLLSGVIGIIVLLRWLGRMISGRNRNL